jgi:hypothetical protein
MLISLQNFLHSCFGLKNSTFSNSTFIHSFFFLFLIIFSFPLCFLYSYIKFLVPYPCCIFLHALFFFSVAAWHLSSNYVPLFAGPMIPSTSLFAGPMIPNTSSATEKMVVLHLSHNSYTLPKSVSVI